MSKTKDVPVYLFTGFLEAGKTKFIQETLEDRRFCNGERTLLLVAALGGSAGAWLGMRLWHHKTLHWKFRLGLPLILVVQLVVAVWLLEIC